MMMGSRPSCIQTYQIGITKRSTQCSLVQYCERLVLPSSRGDRESLTSDAELDAGYGDMNASGIDPPALTSRSECSRWREKIVPNLRLLAENCFDYHSKIRASMLSLT